MTRIQVADQTFIAAPAESATELISDRANWRRWWPDLQLTVVEDRAEQGVRWKVSGPLNGTTELWLEPVLDGFVLHYFLHAEPTSQLPTEPRALMTEVGKINHRRRVAGRAMSFEVKDRLEASRHVGGPAAGEGGVAASGGAR
ncbi:SRPBCC family protein [Williamsia sp. 1135]|uniref:SRPBCC family protein n=1 Tax=Williamsia sp. 1135 TaxID=1889262 RepID=UPI000A120CCD|nr:SRPBCC family protein [Williamsia sp. 1135]ORM33658.1 hypothetical protein BFL43_13475 [Williamsia sp. 1135]